MKVDTWLTAHIGLWSLLDTALAISTGHSQRTAYIDAKNAELRSLDFFRAPARLHLPGAEVESVGVAILIARPGKLSTQLEVDGPFSWPEDTGLALRALERCLQRHADQWLPPRALWDAPAEVLLRGEVN